MRIPEPFDLDVTVRSHGWYDLAPWRYQPERGLLGRPFLIRGKAVYLEVARSASAVGDLKVRTYGQGRNLRVAREATDAMRHCLGLDQDLAPFYALATLLSGKRDLPALEWTARRGAGRLLRSPTVFEDAVKTLCTTNCSWALTRIMVARLVERLGEPVPEGHEQNPGSARCFPTPAAMAGQTERFFRQAIHAGYRAPFLRELSQRVASGDLDIEAWRDDSRPTPELAKDIRALKGFGPYATEHMLKMLGRFDGLALDSWTRAKIARLRGKRAPVKDATIARWFRPFGRYAGLALWLELTADWHVGEAPVVLDAER